MTQDKVWDIILIENESMWIKYYNFLICQIKNNTTIIKQVIFQLCTSYFSVVHNKILFVKVYISIK